MKKISREKLDEIMAWMHKHDMLDQINWDGVKWVCIENVVYNRHPVPLREYKQQWGDQFRKKIKFIMQHRGVEDE